MIDRQSKGLVFCPKVDVSAAALVHHARRWETGLVGGATKQMSR